MQPRQRLALIVAAAVVLVGGFVLASGGDDDGSSTSAGTPTVTSTATQATTTQAPATTTQATTATTQATTPAPPPVPVVRVVGGKPEGGIKELEFDKGDRVRFAVRSDVADEVHVHGYDVSKEVAAGGRATFAFDADIDGIFEVELEGAGVQIAELKVDP